MLQTSPSGVKSSAGAMELTGIVSLSISDHGYRETHSGFHAIGASSVLACDVERRAVVDRCPDNRQANANVDRVVEVDQFHRNVALIVIHGNGKLEVTVKGFVEERVSREWSVAVDTLRSGGLNRRPNHCIVLRPKEAVLSCVWIQSTNSDAPIVHSQQLE